ncbi:GTPase Era [Clostridium sp. 'deep sea']|uniref:GTPase Era n=1 Tax=Clostridium sp. 'deep sea' TaxID=2779445 RepID=UPI0018969FB3|nr:GTPase Era [Clostridium sp. 'deep sea']QOR35598.1 GTPase Era [Clostridium sp. 'deep sea']
MNKKKSGFVAVVGRPNVGKSTFLNKVMGQKVLIESSRPQATRNKISCIYNDDKGQIVFLDTPGIHKPHHKLGQVLVDHAKGSLKGVDVVLFMVEPDEEIGIGDKYIANVLKDISIPIILCVNKIDSINSTKIIPLLNEWKNILDYTEIIPISAKNGEGVNKVIELVYSFLSEGPQYYPDDMLTDKSEKFIIAEMIREKVFNKTKEEVPYSVAVDIRSFTEKNGRLYIAADIIVERNSQKGIIIGKQASMIKRIKLEARKDIERFMGYKADLELHVRHKKDWRNKNNILRDLGYSKE